MTTDANLPPHLECIGRQLLAAAHARNASNAPSRRARTGPFAVLIPAAAAVVLAVVLLTGARPSARSHRPTAQRPTAQRPSALRPTTAKQVLVRAAFVALQTSPVTPRPDQFIYTRTEDGAGQLSESWLSVSGARAGIVNRTASSAGSNIPACVDGHSSSRSLGKDGKPLSDFIPKRYRGTPMTLNQVAKRFFGGKIPTDGPVVRGRCTPQTAFHPKMPTNPRSMLAYLVRIHEGYPPGLPSVADPLNNLAKNIGYMLLTSYFLPAQEAALYRFLAGTSGITISRHVRDVAGRAGVGVEWSSGGAATMLIFSPSSYRFLGWSSGGAHGDGQALLQTAITSSAGQRPAAARSQTTTGSQA
jgi:hypothetical protein